jgi:hypothetical protein
LTTATVIERCPDFESAVSKKASERRAHKLSTANIASPESGHCPLMGTLTKKRKKYYDD